MRRIDVAWEDIYSAALKFLKPLTPRQTYRTIVRESIKLLNADQGTVLLYKNKKLVRVYASFVTIKKFEVSPRGRTFHALQTGEPTVAIVRSEKDIQPEIYKFGFQSIIFIPFSFGIKNKGVLNIFTKQRVRILKNEAFKLRMFGSMISETVYKAEQYKKAEEAMQARDHFIAMASHELKNPLTTILMTAQLIKKIRDEGNTPNEQLIENLITQSLWLSKLMNETLAVGNLKKNAVKHYDGAINLVEVLNLAISSFKANYRTHEVIFKEKVSSKVAFVNADFFKLLQVFVNVLNNAGKYSTNNKPITISLKKTNKFFVTRVTDHGQGISKKDLPHIFDGYYQGGKKDQKGIGLGLYLVRQIVEESGGTVKIDSILHKGTTVIIVLPFYAVKR